MPADTLCAEYRRKRGLPWSAMSSPTPNIADQPAPLRLLLDDALSLAQAQLIGQVAEETSVDGRTMGTLGFSGALLAADLAANDVLGVFWWTPTIILGVAMLCCLSPTLMVGMHFMRGTDLGPNADSFYLTYGEIPALVAREQMLSDVGRAFSSNALRLRAKERALQAAVLTLAGGLPVSAAVIVFSLVS